MTKIQITPKWSEVKPELHYVYIHREESTGRPFYVGLGQNKRGWACSAGSRSNWWMSVARKYGVTIDVAQSGMSRDDAILLEMWLIAKLSHEGFRLVNISEGGEGPIGVESKQKICVYSSAYGEFDSATNAAKYLRTIGYPTATDSNIIGCCKGRNEFMYGSAWSYHPNPVHPQTTDIRDVIARNNKDRCSKAIFCSNRIRFDSVSDAVLWLKSSGYPRASQGSVSRACKTGGVLYSLRWSYDNFPDHDGTDGKNSRYMATKKPVYTSCGLSFESMRNAVDYLVSLGYKGATYHAISRCCSGRQTSAYGFVWRKNA